MALIIPFRGATPIIDSTAWIAPSATLIGNVIVGAGASIWFGAVLRGDMDRIELGDGSNLQDNVVVHTHTGMPALIGENVGVGHQAIIHGARIGSGALVGMGAKLLNGSVVGDGALIAAGALVLEGQEVPPGHLAAGLPAKLRGPLSEESAERVRRNASRYQVLAREYAEADYPGGTIDYLSGTKPEI